MDYPTCAFLCNSVAINFSFRWWENYYKTHSNISDERPLLNYYRGVLIEEIDNRNDIDITSCGMEICNIIRRKVRRELFKEHYYSQREYKVTFTYDFDKSKEDIIKRSQAAY